MQHRADIDGLRALAVIPVVLYHAGVPGFSGGFVGVDVFFVISGFLITTILVEDIRIGRFSIIRFYERRVRRIFPALFVVILVSCAVAPFVLMPLDMKDFGMSTIATTFFSSNIFFWRQTGYFAGTAELLPFLHMWSLSVEEQFYLFFPLFLFVVYRWAGEMWRRLWIMLAMIGSFALSVWGMTNMPNATFFLAPMRAWELLLGAILAPGVLRLATNRLVCELAGWFGVGMIVWSVFVFSVQTIFPGTSALLPCCGAALVIYSGAPGTSTVGRVLGAGPIVFIGLISYSLYLWHWPTLAFARHYFEDGLTASLTMGLLSFAALAAVISWKYVETPFRKRPPAISQSVVFRGSVAVIVISMVYGVVMVLSDGWRSRYDDQMNRIQESAVLTDKQDACFKSGLCMLGQGENPPSFILFGDSHALVLVDVVDRLARERHVAGLYLDSGGCPPAYGLKKEFTNDECKTAYAAAMKKIRESAATTVILAARWTWYFKGAEGNCVDDCFPPRTVKSYLEPRFTSYEALTRGLEMTLDELKTFNKAVYIVTHFPEQNVLPQKLLSKVYRVSGRLDEGAGRSRADIDTRYAEMNDFFTRAENMKLSVNLDPMKLLCEKKICPLVLHGDIMYKDDDHVSVVGTQKLLPMFDTVIGVRN